MHAVNARWKRLSQLSLRQMFTLVYPINKLPLKNFQIWSPTNVSAKNGTFKKQFFFLESLGGKSTPYRPSIFFSIFGSLLTFILFLHPLLLCLRTFLIHLNTIFLIFWLYGKFVYFFSLLTIRSILFITSCVS